MFFNDIETWSKKKLFWMSFTFNALYIACMLVIPIVIICCKYHIINPTTVDKDTVFTGWSLILIIIFCVVGIFALAKVIRKLPDETINQRRFKYTLELLKGLIFPVLCVVVLVQFKKNFDLAYSTVSMCLYSIFAGILLDNLVIKYIDKEQAYTNEVDRLDSIERRKHRA